MYHRSHRHGGYPWGDGRHSLIHNPVTNAQPEGYEVPDPNEGKPHLRFGKPIVKNAHGKPKYWWCPDLY